MIYITNEDELKINNGLTALYFYADWLPFHKKMKIMFDKVEDIYKDINFLAIDIDSFKTSCVRFKIESIPTVLILNNTGKELKRIVGLTMTSAFKKAFADIYGKYNGKKIKNNGDNNGNS